MAPTKRVAETNTGWGLPSAWRSSASSGRTKADRPHTSPHPASGRPESRWIWLAKGESQAVVQEAAASDAQKAAPPERDSTS